MVRERDCQRDSRISRHRVRWIGLGWANKPVVILRVEAGDLRIECGGVCVRENAGGFVLGLVMFDDYLIGDEVEITGRKRLGIPRVELRDRGLLVGSPVRDSPNLVKSVDMRSRSDG